jgi:hypothetical protein
MYLCWLVFGEYKSLFQSQTKNCHRIGRQLFNHLKQDVFREIMNKKDTAASLAIVGLALLATITMTSPTQALALGHWNVDDDFIPNSDMDSSGTMDNTDEEEEEEDSSDEEEEDSTAAANTGEDSTDNSNDKEDSSSSGYEEFQDCLAEIEESPTEEEVQDCLDSSYSGMDNSEDTPIKSTDMTDEEEEEEEDAPGESTDENDEGDTDVTQEYEPRTVS